MMKLIAFRIRNFRAIIDSDWQTLSPDNITCLIGQNESGKTSILEALSVFYTGVISEDILRSDLSLPEVSCRFSIPEGWLVKITDNPGTELRELLSGLSHLELTRKWLPDLSSIVYASGKISEYLDSLEDAWRLYLDDVTDKLKDEISQINTLRSELKDFADETVGLKAKLSLAKGNRRGFSLFGRRAVDLASPPGEQYHEVKLRLTDIRKKEEEVRGELLKRESVARVGETWTELKNECDTLDTQLADLAVKLEERHQKMTLMMRPMEQGDDLDWNKIVKDYRKTRSDRDLKQEELNRYVAFAGYIMEGFTEEAAKKKVNETVRSYKSHVNSEILGKKYFEQCPVIELFEDFGSLLPNRIDMEDIIAGKTSVEGYKAARNFLSLAQVDYSFFEQPSSRILKQKIENLNNALTKNFQEFWQQSIGRNNKIKILFELDHYSSSFGDKAGKPYLEFWIKDEGERLYPKQRSRGVRWFLSFYLELKASASATNMPMVLLVDEPGVSLHARAQEDVLKVFEDISEKIQIIYTTHSPHLVEINKLHRVLAVQRDDLESHRSTTRIIDPLRLSTASPDTLTPLQSILGHPVSTDTYTSSRFNLIVNDVGSFCLLNAIIALTGFKGQINLIPSTNISSIPLMCNIFMGWGMEFGVLLFDNDVEIGIGESLKKNVFKTESSGNELVIKMPGMFHNAEDLLSTLDFKNHILNSREGITIPNSQYTKEKEVPRNFVFSRFLSNVQEGLIKPSDFDEESLENFKLVTDLLKALK